MRNLIIQHWRSLLVVAFIGTVGALLLLSAPIPQPLSYHQFANRGPAAGIPDPGNVLSNLAFAVIGLWGFFWTLRADRARAAPGSLPGQPEDPSQPLHPSLAPRFACPADRYPYLFLFGGLVLVGLGSGYYHWNPTNATLFWDRLAMSLVFMALFAAIVNERFSAPIGTWALPVLIVLGIAGSSHWILTELSGSGDLRGYLLTQAIPLLLGPLFILIYPSRYTRSWDFLVAAGWYLAALIAQTLDHPIHQLTFGWISGHTLKHLLAAIAIFWLLRMLWYRAPNPRLPSSKPVNESICDA